eukprot:scaffold30197_cov67-Phaeocystis_antarctica.AAC.5
MVLSMGGKSSPRASAPAGPLRRSSWRLSLPSRKAGALAFLASHSAAGQSAAAAPRQLPADRWRRASGGGGGAACSRCRTLIPRRTRRLRASSGQGWRCVDSVVKARAELTRGLRAPAIHIHGRGGRPTS